MKLKITKDEMSFCVGEIVIRVVQLACLFFFNQNIITLLGQRYLK